MATEPLISVIDDDESLRAALVRLIRSIGYAARGFGSAEEFLASGVMADCSCVVTDIQMPGMNGIELARAITGQGSTVPVIMITARTVPGLEEDALASGARCFLRKPLDTNVLVKCLEDALKG